MFYSHEVLTSRKYGVATVWLVATLGASNKSKKIGRKAIREVDVPKACQTIVHPGAPMALRLQGNLLYGVSRVYHEQCGYVLGDAESALTNMRLMLKVIRDSALDKEAGKARPEQLVLQDDPSFLPGLTLPPPELLADLSFLEPERARAGEESQTLTLSPLGSQNAPRTPQRRLKSLIIPSSSSVPAPDFRIEGDVPGSVDDEGGVLAEEHIAEPLLEDFGFDADGNFIDFAAGEGMPATPQVAQGQAAVVQSDAPGSAQVRGEHEEEQQVAVQPSDNVMDVDFPIIGSDHPEGDQLHMSSEHRQSSGHMRPGSDDAVSAPVTAMQRKARTRKPIPADQLMELPNRALSDWNNNYLSNMAEARRHKANGRSYIEAKKNAEFLVWGAGIGNIGVRPAGVTVPLPIDMFGGDKLFEMYTGVRRTKRAAGKKHDRDSGIDEATEGEARRVRPRTEDDEHEQQIGRAEGDEEGIMFPPEDQEVELPRDAPVPLDDHQLFSAMPWNSASVRGSSARPRSGLPGSGIGSLSTAARTRRGGRLVSASPLQGRGRLGDSDILRGLEGDTDLEMEGMALPEMMSSEGAFMGEENVQIEEEGVPARRVREPLSAEGGNFLAFIAETVERKQQEEDPFRVYTGGEEDAELDEVLFEDLLPPRENSKMVACQGLMMVLALGTRGLLDVRQDAPMGEIGLKLTDKGKESYQRVVESAERRDEGEGIQGQARGDEDDDDDELAVERQVEEQIAADLAGHRPREERRQEEEEEEDDDDDEEEEEEEEDVQEEGQEDEDEDVSADDEHDEDRDSDFEV